MQRVENVDGGGGLRLHIGVAALIEVHLVALEVALRCQVKCLAPVTICLAVGVGKDILFAADSVEGVLFRHF